MQYRQSEKRLGNGKIFVRFGTQRAKLGGVGLDNMRILIIILHISLLAVKVILIMRKSPNNKKVLMEPYSVFKR